MSKRPPVVTIVARAAAWAFTGSLAGPLSVAFLVTLWSVVRSAHSSAEFVGFFLGEYVLASATGIVVAMVVGFPSYSLLLLFWPIVARYFPRCERARIRFSLAMLIFALPAGVIGFYVNGGSVVSGASSDAFSFAVACFSTAWAGLVIPRLTVPYLRLGSFIGLADGGR